MLQYARGGVPGFFAPFYNCVFTMPKTAGLTSPVRYVRINFENMGGTCAAGKMPVRNNDRQWGA
jgi:hypothetical protein